MLDDMAFLNGLGSAALHAEGRDRSQRLAGATWEMAVCLLAIEQRRVYWQRKHTSTVQYAVLEFGLDGHKAGELLRAAKELQSLPLLRASFRNGELSWSKLREITRVVQPHNEAQWLEFALAHTAEQVARAVVMRPRQVKAQQAATALADTGTTQLTLEPGAPAEQNITSAPLNTVTASTAAEPLATPALPPTGPDTMSTTAQATPATPATTAQAATATPAPLPQAAAGTQAPSLQAASGTPEPPPQAARVAPVSPHVPNKRIRVTLDLTPDQYAIVEQALNEQHRRQGGRRPSRDIAVTKICEAYLAGGSAVGRIKSQVIVHTNGQGDHWYEIERGILKAGETRLPEGSKPSSAPEGSKPARKGCKDATNDSKAVEQPQLFHVEDAHRQANPPNGASRQRRNAVPRDVIKAVRARANGRCEMPGCGRGGRLHLHPLHPSVMAAFTTSKRYSSCVRLAMHNITKPTSPGGLTGKQRANAR